MDLHLPDDASGDDALKAYFRNLIELGCGDAEIARRSGKDATTIRRKFKGWGWVKRWVELEPPAAARSSARANAPPASAKTPPAQPTSPPAAHGQPHREFLEPEVRAKLEAMRKRKQPPPG